MLKHIVMWKFKDQAEGKTRAENCAYIKKMLEALPPIIPCIKSMELGINAYPGEMASDMALTVTFGTAEDLETYKNHPEHVKVSEYVAKVRASRTVVDYLV